MNGFVSFLDTYGEKVYVRTSAVQAVVTGVGKKAPFTNLILSDRVISVQETLEQVLYKLQNN